MKTRSLFEFFYNSLNKRDYRMLPVKRVAIFSCVIYILYNKNILLQLIIFISRNTVLCTTISETYFYD